MSKGAPGVRYAEVERETEMTRTQVVLDLDGGTRRDVSTGIGAFDSFLKLMAAHASLDVGISVESEGGSDDTPIVTEVGSAVGMALRIALTDSDGNLRSVSVTEPVADALVLIALDFSGRGQLVFNVEFAREQLGGLSCQNIQEFFRAMSLESGVTLHIHKLHGANDHFVVEAIFRAVGRCIFDATRTLERASSSGRKGNLA